jgi:hypothetical protein
LFFFYFQKPPAPIIKVVPPTPIVLSNSNIPKLIPLPDAQALEMDEGSGFSNTAKASGTHNSRVLPLAHHHAHKVKPRFNPNPSTTLKLSHFVRLTDLCAKYFVLFSESKSRGT